MKRDTCTRLVRMHALILLWQSVGLKCSCNTQRKMKILLNRDIFVNEYFELSLIYSPIANIRATIRSRERGWLRIKDSLVRGAPVRPHTFVEICHEIISTAPPPRSPPLPTPLPPPATAADSRTPCNFSPLSEIFALVLCTAGDNLV